MKDQAVDYLVHETIPKIKKMRRSSFDEIYAAIYRANKEGMSIPQLGNLYRKRMTRSAIYAGLYARGWSVISRKQRHKPIEYKGFKFFPRGGYTLWCQKPGPYFRRPLSRVVWEDHNGPIPAKHHIYHKDGNYMNNHISNLECAPIGKNFKK